MFVRLENSRVDLSFAEEENFLCYYFYELLFCVIFIYFQSFLVFFLSCRFSFFAAAVCVSLFSFELMNDSFSALKPPLNGPQELMQEV